MLNVTSKIRIPEAELRWQFARSSGPGGQNVNKVSTKALLYWDASRSPSLPDDVRQRFLKVYASRLTRDGQLILRCDRFRSQRQNVEDCRRRLREMLAAVASPPRKRKPTRPSRLAKERRLASKRRHAQKKQRRRQQIEFD